MKNIVLIGMPGSGKTTFGRYLAEILQKDFIDADPEIEKDAGRSIAELFADGEDVFREAESGTVLRLSALQGKVLAMGGGVVIRPENITRLRRTGFVIFLDRKPADIVGDVVTTTRPLLKGGRQRIFDLYAAREALYRGSADATVINQGSIKDVLKQLVEIVKSNNLA
jgi:shikimate kinase